MSCVLDVGELLLFYFFFFLINFKSNIIIKFPRKCPERYAGMKNNKERKREGKKSEKEGKRDKSFC